MLQINWILPGLSLAGGIKSNRLIAEAMVHRGHKVRIIYPVMRKKWPNPIRVRQFAKRVLREWQLWGLPQHHLEESIAELIPIAHRPVLAEDVPDADITIATWWETREWIEQWPAKKGLKVHFIRHYEIHGGDPERVRKVYRMESIKLVISTWLQRLMCDEFDDPNAVLVPNGIDRSQFDAPPRSKAKCPTVGVLYGAPQWKGFETAFRALRLVQQEEPSLRVISFGRDPIQLPERSSLKIEFHLRPGQERIAALYRNCDCWIVPSTIEGFGMPGLEAAASRNPLIATKCGGPEDYVEHGRSGFLVPVGDAEEMAERVLEILRLPEERWQEMSEASYQISRRFDWDISAESLEGVLYDALDSSDKRERQKM